MKYKIAIVEDQKITRDLIKSYISRYEKENNRSFDVLEYEDGLDIVEQYTGDYDIIFLDIEMKHSNGMEIAEKIRQKDKTVIVMFITNMAQYAIKGYAIDALSFLLKPVPYFAFSQEFKRSIEKLDARAESYIIVNTVNGIVKILTRDINYIESMKHTLIFKTKSGEISMRGVMKEMEKKLIKYNFFRCNNFYLVNLAKVTAIQGDYAIVAKDELKISRGRKKPFLEALTAYVGEVN